MISSLAFAPAYRSPRNGLVFLAAVVSMLLVPPVVSEAQQPSLTYTPTPADRLSSLDPSQFPVPDVLAPNVAFWTAVYAQHSTNQSLLHDERYLDIVYEVLDFSDLAALPDTRKRLKRRQRIRDAETRWASVLRDLGSGKRREALSGDYRHVESLFANVPGGNQKYLRAIDHFRSQRCLNDEFARGIVRSGGYLPGIEQIFARRGLPKMLTRLPFVESMFQLGARSTAAAGGVWQFIPATARRFLRMDLEMDERFDPWLAADAAASHLEQSYKSLGEWPLAITAYNHGPAGMRRAVRQLGTKDLGTIAQRYRSRSFGFASRNFYTEFVAAATVYDRRDQLFPGVQPAPALRHDTFVPDQYVSAVALAQAAGIDQDDLKALNPGFQRGIWRGELLLPRGYQVRVPAGELDRVNAAYASLDSSHRRNHQRGHNYKVRRGDTLAVIARRHGTSVRALQQANNLRTAHLIRVGQVLRIPDGRGGSSTRRSSSASSSASSGTATASSTPTSYTVRSGDTLSGIASRHSTSVRAIQQTNGLGSAHRIAVGQRLKIPAGNSVTHVVRRGDTLTKIARRYGTTVAALKRHNSLRSSTIHPSQRLRIP